MIRLAPVPVIVVVVVDVVVVVVVVAVVPLLINSEDPYSAVEKN